MRQILHANGIEPKTANLGFFSIQPVFDWKTAKRKLIGYQITTDVTVKFKDAKVGPIAQQLADANVSEAQTVHYALDDMNDAKSKAVEDGYRRARRFPKPWHRPVVAP